jgi:hypothetical protein
MPTACLLACLLLGAAKPADPVAPLKPLVPADAAVVFVLRDLGPALKRLAESPMAAWFRASPLLGKLLDPKDAENLAAARDLFTTQLGVSAEELRDGIFGQAVVYAFHPAEPGKPETEFTTLLIRPRDQAVLKRLGERLEKLQVASGELVATRPREYGGVTYSVRERAGKPDEFACLTGGILVLSGREAVVRGVIDRLHAPQEPSDGTLPKWLALDDGRSTVAVIFNPRAFDAVWASAGTDEGSRAFNANFAKLWAALDGLCFGVRADAGLTVEVSAAVAPARLPPEWAALLAAPAAKPMPPVAPADALLAVRGRVHLQQLLDVATPFFPDGGKALRAQLDDLAAPVVGRDEWPAVLAKLGPDFTFFVRPSDTAATLEAAFTVRLGPTAADALKLAPPVRQALDAAAQLWRVRHNRAGADQLTIRTHAHGATVEGKAAFPAGFTPTYRVDAEAGTAVVATTPALVTAKPTAAADPPTLRIDVAGWHALLRDRGPAVAKSLAAIENRPAADIEKELGDLLPLLSAFNAIEVRLSRAGNRVAATATVEFVKPLVSPTR